jgi:hypothetical protein
MIHPLDGTLGSLIGRLDVLRVEFRECERFGRYQLAKLIEQHGPGRVAASRTDAAHQSTNHR